METEKLYDLSALIAISRGNPLFVKKMVDMFCEQTPKMISEMFDAYEINNFEKLGAIAHKVKPSIDNLNIGPLKQVIRDIEKMSKETADSPKLPELLNKTDSIIKKVVYSIKEEYTS